MPALKVICCNQTLQVHDKALEDNVVKKLQQIGNGREEHQPAREPIPYESVPQSEPLSIQKPPPVPAPVQMSKNKPASKFRRLFSWLSRKTSSKKSSTSDVLSAQDEMAEETATENREDIGDLFESQSTSGDNSSTKVLPVEYQDKLVNRMKNKSGETRSEDMTCIWDFAGQQLYYITHRESDVIMYDMTNIEIIKYWMMLIYTYAVPDKTQDQLLRAKKPQIVVVGTHSESLEGTDDEKKQKIEKQFGIIFDEIEGTPYECHVVRKMYAIDNKFPLKSVMLKTLKQDVGGFLKAMPKTIPLTWLNFQSKIQEIGRTAIRMTYVEVCEVATKCGISVDNLIHTLNYLHDLGIILYFENNKLLKHTVIINPRKLSDIFRKIITVVEPNDHDKWAAMINLWNKLDNEGILEEELVRHLWRDELSREESSFEVFIELMKQFGLLCEQKNVGGTQRSFFVPCRLKRSKESLSIKPDTDETVSIYVASKDFIPDSVFHPLVVSLIRMIQDMGYMAKPQLFSNNAIITLGRDHILSIGPVVIDNKPSLKLEILHKPIGREGDSCEPSPRVCMQVLEFLKQEMKLLTSGMKHTGYTFCVLCWKDSQETHFHDLDDCLMDTHIPCGKRFIETRKLRRIFKNKKPETDKNLGYLEDKHLVHIASGMGLEWKQLGVRLGLGWNRIQQIWSDHRLTSDCILNMLTEWKNGQNYETNQVKIMDRSLREQGLTELAYTVFGLQTSDDHSSHVNADKGNSCGKLQQEHEGYLKDIDMLFASKMIGSDWKKLGTFLRMTKGEINQIAADYSPTVDACIQMLVQWRIRQKHDVNHLETISDALEKLERIDIKEELLSYYQKKYH
ncbi:uncharacterized protein LOC117108102 [Anneissia japonica]|uniref:uncharacterized protein LOC117108102 n=1 Tax=Anneissia japonica TaxID=1529436 RepID=UPI0014258B0B|nr:uncharacterized protein LOC117108102 [Anneissia japonica]